MMLFGESDGVGHHFWKYCDPKSPLFTDQPPGLRDAILKVYQELDRQTGELLDLMPPETNVLMMSDHGFGGVSDWVLYPNCWLREKGFLKFKGGMWKSRMMDAAKLRAVGILPDVVKKMMFRFGRGKLGQYEAKVRYGFIGWEGTEAYFEENPYYPVLWINLKGREPKGIVEPERYEEVRSRLIAELESWRHPETGERIVEKAYRREEVYSGAVLCDAADIIVKWGLHKNYNYSFRLSSKSKNLAWAERVDPHAPQNLPFYHGKSGHHRDDGIFLAYGPDIRPGYEVSKARIIDLAPTLLNLLGVAVPNDMDGKVLEDIFTEGYAREAMVQWSAEAAPESKNGADGVYSSEDEALISDRLKSLGYVE
jgi:predicted AlkP superfamily phosphohydrolase/phosphomutase